LIPDHVKVYSIQLNRIATSGREVSLIPDHVKVYSIQLNVVKFVSALWQVGVLVIT